MKRMVIGVFILVSVAGLGARAYYSSRTGQAATVRTAKVSEGSIVEAVSATGTLQAVTTVQVGTQVSGTIEWLGADFNSVVRKGQVIARLDTSLIDAQIEQARANLVRAAADVDSSRVRLSDAQQKYDRAKALADRQLVSQSDLDAARVAVDSAAAQLKASEAQRVQAQATLNQNDVNLQHTVLAAPIDGTVISRSVDVGQTVAASLSSPTLFSIAADLAQMQVVASIDESDIGRIGPEQHVTFKVDAFPSEVFTGKTVQVRLQPSVVQNVTTYNVIIDAPNPELKLKPGMTATVSIEIARRDQALRIPNGALRFSPTADTAAALGLDASVVSGSRTRGRQVWTSIDGRWTAVDVTLGISDGQTTELLSANLAPGAEVVTNVATATEPTRAAAGLGGLMGPGGGFAGGQGGARQGGLGAPQR